MLDWTSWLAIFLISLVIFVLLQSKLFKLEPRVIFPSDCHLTPNVGSAQFVSTQYALSSSSNNSAKVRISHLLTDEDLKGISVAHLIKLKSRWLSDQVQSQFAAEYEAYHQDGYICPENMIDLDILLCRYLRAVSHDDNSANIDSMVELAFERLVETVRFRAQYRCVDFCLPGMAQLLFMHGPNKDAAMYFGDCGVKDRSGQPVIIGRLDLIKDVPCHPGNHLRAGLFVIERAVRELCFPQRNVSYILDLSTLNDKPVNGERFWDMYPPAPGSRSIGPQLASHRTLKPGLDVLREAMKLVTAHYPEILGKVFFYDAPLWFRGLFKIFSLWVDKTTRKKFVMVRKSNGLKELKKYIDPEELPVEFGGFGESLGSDEFLSRAVNRYDIQAELHVQAKRTEQKNHDSSIDNKQHKAFRHSRKTPALEDNGKELKQFLSFDNIDSISSSDETIASLPMFMSDGIYPAYPYVSSPTSASSSSRSSTFSPSSSTSVRRTRSHLRL